jgi:hypothetical protein
MNTFTRLRLGRLVPLLALALAGPGCSGGVSVDPADSGRPAPGAQTAPTRPGLTPVVPNGDVKRKEVARHVWFETEGKTRRVRVEAAVCLRRGEYGLECLLCRTKTKVHESVLATSADAFEIHKNLMAAGAEYGSPARFDVKYKPPSGSRVKISLEYEDQGKLVTAPAGYWVRDVKTKKELDSDWIFTGSVLYPNPDGDDKPKIYAANSEGGYVYVINWPTSMLDLPVRTPSAPEQRAFEPFTEHIPEVGTPVIVIFEPVADSDGAKAMGKN